VAGCSNREEGSVSLDSRRRRPAADVRGGALTPSGVTLVGLFVNVLLALAKMWVGLTLRSQTLLADGLHSVSDLVTDSAVLVGLRISGRPADDCSSGRRCWQRRVG